MRQPVRWSEIFGLQPFLPRVRQMWTAVVGDPYLPPSLWGFSSLKMLRPWRSVPLWLGRRDPHSVLIYNLPNRHALERLHSDWKGAYSVRVTDILDFRGRDTLSYDSHIGTDFAVPPGTEIVASAPGRVVSVSCEMQRGGLKVQIDHGEGLLTASNHIARALVEEGDEVKRGQVIALSGMSSIDGVLFAPWLAPHLHFNASLNGVPVDPWAGPDEVSLWKDGVPRPATAEERNDTPGASTRWNPETVASNIASMSDPEVRRKLESTAPERQGAALALQRMIRPQAFERMDAIVDAPYPRSERLTLPFQREDYRSVIFADDLAIC